MKKTRLSAAQRREENWGWIMVAPTIIGLFVLISQKKREGA